jgi:hypothetical protein
MPFGGGHSLRGLVPAEAAGRGERIAENVAATNKGTFSVRISKLKATEDSSPVRGRGPVIRTSGSRLLPVAWGAVKVAFQSLNFRQRAKGTPFASAAWYHYPSHGLWKIG